MMRRFWGDFVVREVLAYGRSALVAPTGARLVRRTKNGGTGVLLVHGLGATSAQFISLARALEPVAHRVDVFAYAAIDGLPEILHRVTRAIHHLATTCEHVVVIGHSFGGLILRMVLQGEEPLPKVRSFVAICAPLLGTDASRFMLLFPERKQFAPGSEFFRDLDASRDRLMRLSGVLTVASTLDHLIRPWNSAHLLEHETMTVDDVGHVTTLFDARVLDRVASFVERTTGAQSQREGAR